MQAVKVENNAFEDLAEALVRSRIRRCEPEIEKDQPIHRYPIKFF